MPYEAYIIHLKSTAQRIRKPKEHVSITSRQQSTAKVSYCQQAAAEPQTHSCLQWQCSVTTAAPCRDAFNDESFR